MAGGARTLFAAAALAAGAAVAEPAPPGASACAGCHGPATREGGIPSLHGQSAEAIANKLLAFRAGQSEPTLMDRIAKGFSEPELQAIARWIAAQP